MRPVKYKPAATTTGNMHFVLLIFTINIGVKLQPVIST